MNKYIDQNPTCASISSTNGKPYQIDSVNALRFDKNPCGLAGSTDIYMTHKGIGYHFSIPIQENYDKFVPTLNQILSTFKFTNSSSPAPDIINWKTYTSTGSGVTFKYPAQYAIKETYGQIQIGNNTKIYLITGHDRYFGCGDICPKNESMVINGKQVFMHTGTENSIGGIFLLEYEFPGINPESQVVSSETEYHLFFDYIGNHSDKNAIDDFNNLVKTVEYKYGREPGPAG